MRDRIPCRSARVAIVGLGYVGLPLAVLCTERGYRVFGIEADVEKKRRLNQGLSHTVSIRDEQLRDALQGGLTIVQNHRDAPPLDVVVICVQTPLSDHQPDYGALAAAIEAAAAHPPEEKQLIIVESTVEPGTTEGEILPRLAAAGRKVGRDVYLGFSPERSDPGGESGDLRSVPRIVSGVTPECRSLTDLFYRQLGIITVFVDSPAVAEMAKLLENTYRDVNIALVNEMAQVCREAGIDVREVIRAAATKGYGFQAFNPGHGVGGHCIPVDSVYYSHWADSTGAPAALAETARRINQAMPGYAVERIKEELACRGRSLPGAAITFLGVTYKQNVDDVRGSPTLSVIDELSKCGAQVTYHDPFIHELHVDGSEMERIPLRREMLSGQDCVVLAVAHDEYDPDWVGGCCSLVVDMTGRLSPSTTPGVVDLFHPRYPAPVSGESGPP